MSNDSKTTQRDELALDIFLADNSSIPEGELLQDWADAPDHHRPYAQNIADGLIAAGYRKPRTITTVEELDALPDGSVVRDSYSDVHEKIGQKWLQISDPDPFEPEWLGLPVAVLDEPKTEATR